ncbi:FAD-dependent monooxygenase [Actinoplanes oblitus]|uniref:FAD-dependent monooxygenase n=1 Tax=Actinoplanes oblitus TaxID=3040509 RepID=A0ABY8WRR8_9ACTN|nr:FAD-dependent monooxygenase [Actinoplanes oblitus]WIN00597.1 FAD-dependent monooxygenase [Actinoplanes oblitus]
MVAGPTRHALVLGAGLAGSLAAAALARRFDTVTMVERDDLRTAAGPRRGIPQARQSHLLMGAGARAMESLVPGVLGDLRAAGAHFLAAPTEVAFLTKYGWLPRTPHDEYVVCCGRDLLDRVVRNRVLARHRIEVLDAHDVVGLLGVPTAVGGAVVRSRRTGEQSVVAADFVVAATGRSSRVASWLRDLGLPEVPDEVVDAGTAYATRIFDAGLPPGQRAPAIVMIANVTGDAVGGVLLPIEDGLMTATMIGMRGSEPPTGDTEFLAFAKQLPHPEIADVLAAAQPVGPARGFRGLVNRRSLFERLPAWPERFVAVGDAAAVLNPAHAHGMSVAAFGVAALAAGLERHGNTPGLAGRVQRAVRRRGRDAWDLAVSDDLRHPRVLGPRPGPAGRVQNRYADRITHVATARPPVTRALVDVIALAKPVSALLTPRLLWAAARGPGQTRQQEAGK